MAHGSVVSFGQDGWGIVRGADGAEYPFHSTAIADGTRRIAPETDVTFDLCPGRQGRWEATAIHPR